VASGSPAPRVIGSISSIQGTAKLFEFQLNIGADFVNNIMSGILFHYADGSHRPIAKSCSSQPNAVHK
jgi:hypothetical protein